MNKTELIERIAEEAGVPEGEAQRHFGAFERVVTEALKGDEEVRIMGFGKFSVKERKAREGRNPRTGEKMKIKASKVPAFSAGNALKGAIWEPTARGDYSFWDPGHAVRVPTFLRTSTSR